MLEEKVGAKFVPDKLGRGIVAALEKSDAVVSIYIYRFVKRSLILIYCINFVAKRTQAASALCKHSDSLYCKGSTISFALANWNRKCHFLQVMKIVAPFATIAHKYITMIWQKVDDHEALDFLPITMGLN